MLLPNPVDPVFLTLKQFLKKEELNLVDLAIRTKNGTTSVHIVIDSPDGLSLETCTHAHRLMLPLLEELLQTEDLYVEVSSPGLDRSLKYDFEFDYYKERYIKILLLGESEWHEGILKTVGESELTVEETKGLCALKKAQISKAKLHEVQNGRKE